MIVTDVNKTMDLGLVDQVSGAFTHRPLRCRLELPCVAVTHKLAESGVGRIAIAGRPSFIASLTGTAIGTSTTHFPLRRRLLTRRGGC